MKWITAVTNNEPYPSYAKKLEKCFKQFNLDYEIIHYPNTFSWVKNTHEKPKIIRKVLEKYDKVCWIDADSTILKFPEYLFKINKPVGLHWRHQKTNLPYICSGTMVWSRESLDLLDRWIEACKTESIKCDDQVLDMVLDYKVDINKDVQYIPKEYCKLNDRYDDIKESEVVISQYRASREGFPAGIRALPDGTYKLLRENKISRTYLDNHFDRIDNYTWKPRYKYIKDEYKDKYSKQSIINIIGKGPSLSYLNREHLQGYPVICVNDSVRVLESFNYVPLYCVVQDTGGLGTYLPKYATVICSQHSYAMYSRINGIEVLSYGKNIGENLGSLPISALTPTVVIALLLAHLMGARTCRMISFDSVTNNNYTYSPLVETKKQNNPILADQKVMINKVIGQLGLDMEWITPSLEVSVS